MTCIFSLCPPPTSAHIKALIFNVTVLGDGALEGNSKGVEPVMEIFEPLKEEILER